MKEPLVIEGAVLSPGNPAPATDFVWAQEQREIEIIEAEAIGWLPLEEGAYLHVGHPDEEQVAITVTGVPEVGMGGMDVLLVGW